MLIDAKGWVAQFSSGQGERKLVDEKELVCWQENDNGRVVGLFVDSKTKRLRVAEDYDNFVTYAESSEPDPMMVPAAIGWWAVSKDHDEPAQAWWRRVLVWLVEPDGWGLKALTPPDPDGFSQPEDPNEACQFWFDPGREKEGQGPWPVIAAWVEPPSQSQGGA